MGEENCAPLRDHGIATLAFDEIPFWIAPVSDSCMLEKFHGSAVYSQLFPEFCGERFRSDKMPGI
jgi:hypothetical protein